MNPILRMNQRWRYSVHVEGHDSASCNSDWIQRNGAIYGGDGESDVGKARRFGNSVAYIIQHRVRRVHPEYYTLQLLHLRSNAAKF